MAGNGWKEFKIKDILLSFIFFLNFKICQNTGYRQRKPVNWYIFRSDLHA